MGAVTARGPRSVAIGGSNYGIVITGDIFSGEFIRLTDARQRVGQLYDSLDLRRFTGRQWLAAEFDVFLEQRDRGYFFLEAPAGLGKTAFCAWLAHVRGYFHHFVGVPGGFDTGAALRNLSAQLVAALGLTEAAPGGVLPPSAGRSDAFAELLIQAAEKRDRDWPGRRIVMVVDALDEAPQAPGQVPLGLPRTLPRNIYILASRRPGTATLPVEPQAVVYELLPESMNNLTDVSSYLRTVLNEEPLASRLQDNGIDADDLAE